MLERIEKVLRTYKGSDDLAVTMDTTFEELGFDSLDTVEIVMALEDEFAVTLEVDESVKSVGDLARLIEQIS